MTNTEYEGAHSGLRTEIQCQEDRLVQYNAGTTESLGRLFGDLTNCTIGSLTVNVRPIFNVQSAEKVDKEFDGLVQHTDFDYGLLYGVQLLHRMLVLLQFLRQGIIYISLLIDLFPS